MYPPLVRSGMVEIVSDNLSMELEGEGEQKLQFDFEVEF